MHQSKNSTLWTHFQQFPLTENNRVDQQVPHSAEFIDWLLNLGDGTLPTVNGEIEIPGFIRSHYSTMTDLIQAIYDDINDSVADPISYFQDRAILSPLNKTIDILNDHIMETFPGEEKEYQSIDTVSDDDNQALFPPEYLNTINISGLPRHSLKLKLGCPIMLLRNLNPSKGLANGTRLVVTGLLSRLIKAKILTGSHRGQEVHIPRIKLTPSNSPFPFDLQRNQFPVRVAFSMTINKSQGQSLEHVGIYLPDPVFSHGQLYVACSRSKNPNHLHMLIGNQARRRRVRTKNVVYREVFNS